MDIWERLGKHPGIEVVHQRLSAERILFLVYCDVNQVSESDIENIERELLDDGEPFEIRRHRRALCC